MTGWEFGDAWFATAVAIQENPCDLADVIAAGDAIDHAIFTRKEIQQAVSRLVGAGFVRVSDDGRFALTSAGADLLERRQGGLFEQVDSVLELLRGVPVKEVPWSITEEAVRSAYVAYMQSGDPDTRGRSPDGRTRAERPDEVPAGGISWSAWIVTSSERCSARSSPQHSTWS